MKDNEPFSVDVSDLSYREAGIAVTLKDDPATAAEMVRLVVNGWPFMDSQRRAKIICLAMTDGFRAWARAGGPKNDHLEIPSADELEVLELYRQLDPAARQVFTSILRRLATGSTS